MSYLHYSLLNFHTYDMLTELIENFFNKESEMQISSFYSKCKTNGDIAYILFTLIDKFSFGNSYEQMSLLNAEIYNGRKSIEKYVKKDYNITNVSQSANEYANKIIQSDLLYSKRCFIENTEDDDAFSELDTFENDVIGTMEIFENCALSKSCYNSSNWDSSQKTAEDEDKNGLSKVIGNNDIIYENCGTLLFKASELIIGSNYSFSADIWSVGICLFYLLFKRFPIEESDKHLLKQKIIRDNFMESFIQKGITSAKYATQVIFQCLVKEPNKRKNVYEILNISRVM